MERAIFRAVLIKPSHYDDDGYVIQWHRSLVPANSLASLHGLIQAQAGSGAVGDDTDIDVVPIDETNTHVCPDSIARSIHEADAGFVGMVGVQSCQFPRAMDIARQLREKGITVVIGGPHVSGVMALLGDDVLGLGEARELGISLFAGEAEDLIGELLSDIVAGTAKPLYNTLANRPSLQGKPGPWLPEEVARRVEGLYGSFGCGRGCPYDCSFCTIANIQGRGSRPRSADDVERIIRKNYGGGIRRFLIVDDNFARNVNRDEILARMAALRSEGVKARHLMQVDAEAHRIPGFVRECRKAGVLWVLIGIESINPDNLKSIRKRQNRIAGYREMLEAWGAVGIGVIGSYIIGFQHDTPASVREDILTIKRDLPLHVLSVFMLTPMPGSKDHQELWEKKGPLEPDLNQYDLIHAATTHPHMEREEWAELYRSIPGLFYDDENIERIMRRNIEHGRSAKMMAWWCTCYKASLAIEKVHPLDYGWIRRRCRTQRRPGRPIVPALLFYPWHWATTASRLIRFLALLFKYRRLAKKVEKSNRRGFTEPSR